MKFAVITLAAAMFAAAAPVQAQQQEGRRSQARAERMDPTKRIERRVEALDKRLDLNDDQTARIRTILTQEAEHMKARYAARGPRTEGQRSQPNAAVRDSARAQMKAARERTDAAILQVLNASQREQYQKFQQEKQERAKRGGDKGGKKRGEKTGTRAS